MRLEVSREPWVYRTFENRLLRRPRGWLGVGGRLIGRTGRVRRMATPGGPLLVVSPGGIPRSADKRSYAHFIEISRTLRSAP
jgi:hypothetical protein